MMPRRVSVYVPVLHSVRCLRLRGFCFGGQRHFSGFGLGWGWFAANSR